MTTAKRITLSDDGTMDTVLVCTICREQFRYTWDGDCDHGSACHAGEQHYADFVAWAIEDAQAEHVCPTNVQCRGCGVTGQVIQDEPVLMWACASCSLIQHVVGSEVTR